MLAAIDGASPEEMESQTPKSTKSCPYRFVRVVEAFRAE